MQRSIIDAQEALFDIQDGMDDAGLMEKYSVSARGVQSLFKKLVDAGFLNLAEVASRASSQVESLVVETACKESVVVETEHVGVPATRTTKVLAISDNKGLLCLIEDLCEEHDMLAITYENCLPELEVLRELKPELVITDMDPEVAENRAFMSLVTDLGICTPLLVIVEQGRRSRGLLALDAGAYDFIEKPLETRLLVRLIQRGVEHCKLVRSASAPDHEQAERVRDLTVDLIPTQYFLRGLIDSSTLVSVVITDLDQTIRFWNRGAENIFGYTADEIVGTKITRLYPKDALTKETVEQLRALIANQTGTVHGKMKQVARDGRILTIALALSPMKDASGQVIGILGIGLDITEETRQSRELFNLARELKKTQDMGISALTHLVQFRPDEDSRHLQRLQRYCRVICQHLAQQEAFKEVVHARFAEDVVRLCVLHDIGKLAIPEAVFYCGPDGSADETVRQHTVLGGKAIEDALGKGSDKGFLAMAAEIAYYHHEHWDGTGYPFGRKGAQIPLAARIVAMADTYDTLTTEGPCREALSHEEACRIIREAKGTRFDPVLVDLFEAVESEFWSIRSTLSEG